MTYSFFEITPQDQYIIKQPKDIDLYKISYLLDLYQPITGSNSINFYLILLNQIGFGQAGISQIHFHRQLTSQMRLSFPEIMKARKVLEAIGLLKTKRFVHQKNGDRLFEYTLFAPYTPELFFQSDILSILLLNRLGANQFQNLKTRLLKNREWEEIDEYIDEGEITKSFDDIFDPIVGSEIQNLVQINDSQRLENQRYTRENELGTVQVKQEYLDFDFIKGMASSLFKVDKILDEKMMKLFNQLAYLYQLTDMDVIELLHDQYIYNETGDINEELLRKRVVEKYQFEQKEIAFVNKDEINTLLKNQEQTEKLTPPKYLDKAKRHQWLLDNISPVELLKKYQGGGKVPDADLKLIEELLIDYQLSSGVVNVLIEYILLSNNKKLPKNLTEKIAGHWKRSNISTVEEAQALAKKEHRLYKDWQSPSSKKETGATGTPSTRKRTTAGSKTEKIPDYILKQTEKFHPQNQGPAEQTKEDKDQTIDKIQQLLKDLGEIE